MLMKNKKNNDTVDLLKECNAGVKMCVNSIDEVLDHVKSEKLKKCLNRGMEDHQRIGSEIHAMLEENNESGKEFDAVARGMSWLKTNVMLKMDENDNTVADLITDGCNMGIKHLNRYLNEFSNADERSKDLTKEIISVEKKMTADMKDFL